MKQPSRWLTAAVIPLLGIVVTLITVFQPPDADLVKTVEKQQEIILQLLELADVAPAERMEK